jgi:type III secretory pathway component EscR
MITMSIGIKNIIVYLVLKWNLKVEFIKYNYNLSNYNYIMPSYEFVKLIKMTTGNKKYKVILKNTQTGREKSVSFGAKGYEDYTMHKDEKRKENYISRHKARENWTKSGIDTAGWWAKNLLWSETTIEKALREIKRKYF